jgi:hypothetical protein
MKIVIFHIFKAYGKRKCNSMNSQILRETEMGGLSHTSTALARRKGVFIPQLMGVERAQNRSGYLHGDKITCFELLAYFVSLPL